MPVLSGVVGANVITDLYRNVLKLLWRLFTSSEDAKKIEEDLSKELQQQHSKEEVEKLIDTLHKMADGLLPAAKNTVQPIGISCNTMQFGNITNNYFVTLDEFDKQAIIDREFHFTDLEEYRVVISELDMQKATCKISLQDDLKIRFKSVISDPQVKQANNSYDIAMNSKRTVRIFAKQKLDNEVIKEFIINDIKLDGTISDS